jgi:TolB-like protein
MYSGHYQISTAGQEEVIQIGIHSGELGFESLPPMNLAFVIDKSGSMQNVDKMDWVKESFDIFIEKVRSIDFVSLVVFDGNATVLYPSTKMNSRERRLAFKRVVHSITPGGGTNLRAGLELGYQQVLSNFRNEYTNRVLFLTDGVGEASGILEMAESYKEMGINVSTIGVGKDFDLNLMTDLAKRGGGSSRFISDREEMEEIFGSDLDRMVVPVARNLSMTLEFLLPVEVLDTWGYKNEVQEQKILYAQDTMHHADDETIVVHIKVLPQAVPGTKQLARFTVDYEDLEGGRHRCGPHTLSVEFVSTVQPVSGFSNGMVLKSGSMMRFAQLLVQIGDLYYGSKDALNQINSRRDELWQAMDEEVSCEALTSPEIEQLESAVSSRMQFSMDLTVEMKKELENARLRLDNEGFDDEIGILEDYIDILGKELHLEQERITAIRGDAEIAPAVGQRSVQDHLVNLFNEMILDLRAKSQGAIAVSGFALKDGRTPALVDLLNEMAVVEIGRIDTLKLVERKNLDAVLKEQELALTDLIDTQAAIQVGKFLAANYIVTGTLIEMTSTVVIFGRVIDVQTGEVESVAQVILPKDQEVNSLLS